MSGRTTIKLHSTARVRVGVAYQIKSEGSSPNDIHNKAIGTLSIELELLVLVSTPSVELGDRHPDEAYVEPVVFRFVDQHLNHRHHVRHVVGL